MSGSVRVCCICGHEHPDMLSEVKRYGRKWYCQEPDHDCWEQATGENE